MRTWITSDTHFGHKRILDFCQDTRPWANVEEMNEALLTNWNETISNEDILYHLGDLSFMKREDTKDNCFVTVGLAN